MNIKTWKIEAVALIAVLAIEPSTEALSILKSTEDQYKSMHIEQRFSAIFQVIAKYRESNKIEREVEEVKNKTLVLNKTIGFRKVLYWQHKIKDMLYVKNDSILIHFDMSNKITHYRKKWTNISVDFTMFEERMFEPENYHWKKLVIFPDSDDFGYFYTLTTKQEYPVTCWEVRHKDGSTILYNETGKKIGHGVPAPSYNTFTLSGYDNSTPHDTWRVWRENANEWFTKWFGQTISLGRPSNEQVSYYISNPDTMYFYEIAHSGGEPTRFQTNAYNVYYTAEQLREDMKDREPMKLAILCSCEAMQSIDPGTLSYELRKGQTTDTITIGYVGMGSCTGWVNSLDWQDAMFTYIDRGHTIKQAFNFACSIYPEISDCVQFVGDKDIRISSQIKTNNILKQLFPKIQTTYNIQ